MVVVGVGAIVLPRGMGWAVVSLGVAAVLVVSVTARSLGGTVTCIGALANLAVVQLNGGMPTEANAFFRLVGPAGYARYASRTYLENLNTKLPLLDDRIVLPHPIPFAEVFSVGDLIIMIGLVVIILEGMLARPVASSSVLDEGQIVA